MVSRYGKHKPYCVQTHLLMQVFRHGWGCPQDLPRAVTYLSAAASNSAAVEAEALRAGVKKGGSAKGELVLAMFELANCFRNGWGLAKDPAAARQYYETAANLGDTDAMNEVGWCYLEGFGGKKDKVCVGLPELIWFLLMRGWFSSKRPSIIDSQRKMDVLRWATHGNATPIRLILGPRY